jgi:D-beta-D-heptose 7-phosphate kinase/D-beta-D-heptose 1-phosphate adenosyltransferase
MDKSRLAALLNHFCEKTILVLGDVMLDRFVWGNVSRISPEAPVPVVHVTHESAYPGGAANVARNLLPFAKKVHIMGLIGAGPQGDLLLENFQADGLETDQLQRDTDYETIVKTRVVARNQQVVRIDRETPRPVSEAVVDRLLAKVEALMPEIDGIVMEDYGKGLLSQRLVDGVVALAQSHEVCVTVDPNTNNAIKWSGVTAVKPNRSEAFQTSGVLDHPLSDDLTCDPTLLEVGQRLRERWSCQHLVITLGELGMVLMSEESDTVFHVPPKARDVFDVSGAGDTAIALFTLALCSGASAREATDLSNHASSIVVGKIGTATISPEELTAAIAADR